MPFSTTVIRLLNKIDEPIREVLIAILEEIETQRDETVTKKEFNELTKNLNTLTEQVTKLTIKVNELAKAQEKTEQRLDELTETVNQLAEAQKKTEEQIKKLFQEHKKTRENLGGLSHSFGYFLENQAYIYLPELLMKDYSLNIPDELIRDYIEISPGKYVEINIIGKGIKNGKEYYIIGECKTQLKKRDVDNYLRLIEKLKLILGDNIFPVLVTHQTSPQVKNYIKSKNIPLYFSYQFKNKK